ncbi:MAG: TIGR04255 family protein, partial [Halobacteriota archaeon]
SFDGAEPSRHRQNVALRWRPGMEGELRGRTTAIVLDGTAMTPAEERHYDRAPIVEAIVSIQITPIGNDGMASLEGVSKALSEAYPNVQPLRHAAEFLPSAGHGDSDGYVSVSEDGKQIVQSRTDGFSFSRLAPYDRWESFVSEARRTWDAYAECVGSFDIQAFSVRYINELKIPFGTPLREFFNIYPALPDPSQLLSMVFMYYSIGVPLMGGTATVSMASIGATSDGRARILLDNTFRFPVTDQLAIWENMPQVRKLKNDTFESQLRAEFKETLV